MNLSVLELRSGYSILVVRYGNDKTGGEYWLMKNSWGTSWGESGYIWIALNRNNQCNIANYAVYSMV